MANIRIGIGGWTYEPWRETFYPEKLPARRELEHASRQVTAIEVNGTYYSTMTAKSFERWFAETPDDFMFALKANRFATNRRVLAEAGESIARFIGSGLARLEHKLGPVLWQFAPTKKFDADDFEAFLKLLPMSKDARCATCSTCATTRSGCPGSWRWRASTARRWCSPIRRTSRRSPTSRATSSTCG
jgi:uncharacterized protein YecE (DUF72 family)